MKAGTGRKSFDFKKWQRIEILGLIAALAIPVVAFLFPISDPDTRTTVGAILGFGAAGLIVFFSGSLLRSRKR